jgi:hypothetical protein
MNLFGYFEIPDLLRSGNQPAEHAIPMQGTSPHNLFETIVFPGGD